MYNYEPLCSNPTIPTKQLSNIQYLYNIFPSDIQIIKSLIKGLFDNKLYDEALNYLHILAEYDVESAICGLLKLTNLNIIDYN